MSQKLGPYFLDGVLGRGGMGTVYKARHEETGEVCAVKALAPVYANDDHFRNRFNSEIESLIKLDHPNIVRLISYGQDEGNLFFAMELVEGKSLFMMQRDGHKFDWREVIIIGKDVCKGLRHAHDRGVIHRDLKPGNLLKPDDGPYKITDFGIAKQFGASQITGDNVIGTMDFMSPEQAKGKPVTVRSDLYSLGTVMFTLLSGKAPFSANSIEESLRNLTKVPAPKISSVVPEVPQELDILIRKLMAKDPAKRIPTAQALYTKLDDLEKAFRYQSEAQTAENRTKPNETFHLENTGGSATQHQANQATAPFQPKEAAATNKQTTIDISDELKLAPVPQPESKQDYFQTVTPDERRKKTPGASEDRTEASRGSIIGLILILAIVVGGAIYGVIVALRPPSANQLFATIDTATAPENVREEIKLFLNHYGDDERAPQVQLLGDIAKAVAIKNRLLVISGTTGNLSEIQQKFVDIANLMDSEPEQAQTQMSALANVYEGNSSLSESDRECIFAAKHMALRIDVDAKNKIRQQIKNVRESLERASGLTEDPGKSAEIYRSIIKLHENDEWANELVDKAKNELKKLGYSQ